MLQRACEETPMEPAKHRKEDRKIKERKLHPEVSQGQRFEGDFLLDKTLWSCKKM